MSHIFDALQRSEAERGGSAPSAAPAATELLERAERQAVQQWKFGAAFGSPDPDMPQLAPSYGPGVPAVGVAELNGSPVLAMPADGSSILSQFPSLAVSFPPQKRLVSVAEPDSPAAEAFRLLAVRLRHLRRDRTLRRVLITSSIPEEGKSLVSANLACTLAAGPQQKVLLLEGDLRRPSLLQLFGAGETPGIGEWLRGERSLTSSIYRVEDAGIWILPAGRAVGNSLEVMQSGKLPALMEQLTAWFDWVIIDSPPVMPLADTSVWARMADGILLVTRPGVTQKRQLTNGLAALESKKLIGAILNSSKSEDNGYYYYRRAPSEPHSAVPPEE